MGECSHKHLIIQYDNLHIEFLNNQINLINDLFNDLNFNKYNINNYKIIFTYAKCLDIWQLNFGKELCKQRANKLNGIGVSKSSRGKKKSEEHKLSLSISHLGNTPWNKGLTIEDERVRKNIDKRNE